MLVAAGEAESAAEVAGDAAGEPAGAAAAAGVVAVAAGLWLGLAVVETPCLAQPGTATARAAQSKSV